MTDQNLNTKTLSEANGPLFQEDLVLKSLTVSYHKWQSAKPLQSKSAHQHLHTSLTPLIP